MNRPSSDRHSSRAVRASPARALLVFALLLAGLLTLVAVASSTVVESGDGSGDGGAVALPSWFSSYLFTITIVGGFFVLLLSVLVARRAQMDSAGGRRKGGFTSLGMLIVAIVFLVLAVRNPENVSSLVERIRPGGLAPDRVNPERAATPAFAWIAVAVGSAALIAAAAAALAVPVVRRTLGRRRDSSVAEALAATLEATLDDVRTEPDPRRAIILAYARMESVLDSCGVPRRRSEAPLEYLARVLLELEVTPAPVETLTELFERAKFRHHEMPTPLKDRAIEALETVRAELRGPE